MKAQKSYQQCGLGKTIDLLGNKWTVAIVYSLLEGTKRFAELQTELTINPRTLSQRLKDLEEHGIITRQTYAEVPPRVEYSLTKKGQSLSDIIKSMEYWGSCKA